MSEKYHYAASVFVMVVLSSGALSFKSRFKKTLWGDWKQARNPSNISDLKVRIGVNIPQTDAAFQLHWKSPMGLTSHKRICP